MLYIYLSLWCLCVYGPIYVIGQVCNHGGKIYPSGADISRANNNCYGLICNNGQVVAWDGKCSFITPACPGGVNVWVDGQCCPICMSSTFPPTTLPTTSITTDADNTTDLLKGCEFKGRIYAYGTVIQYDDRCEKCVCSSARGFLCEPVTCSGANSIVTYKTATRTFAFYYFAITILLKQIILLPWTNS